MDAKLAGKPITLKAHSLFVGIDIGKDNVSVVPIVQMTDKPKAWTIKQNQEDYKRLVSQLDKLGYPRDATLIIMEATSTYWIPIATYLVREGYSVTIANPTAAHRYMGSTLQRSKNDPTDALGLAQMGKSGHPSLKFWCEPPPIYDEINQRLQHFADLNKTSVAYQNRAKALKHRNVFVPSVHASIRTLRQSVSTEEKAMEKQIHDLLKDDPEWGASYRRLIKITGIKTITAASLLASTLNFSLCDTAEQAASFAGLVPREKSSAGKVYSRPRIGHSGNQVLRRLMVMAAWNAHRFVPDLKVVYDRHIKNSKGKRKANIAIARKLMCICWICVRLERDFDPTFNQKRKAARLAA